MSLTIPPALDTPQKLSNEQPRERDCLCGRLTSSARNNVHPWTTGNGRVLSNALSKGGIDEGGFERRAAAVVRIDLRLFILVWVKTKNTLIFVTSWLLRLVSSAPTGTSAPNLTPAVKAQVAIFSATGVMNLQKVISAQRRSMISYFWHWLFIMPS